MKNKKLKYTYNVTGLAIIVFLAVREISNALLFALGLEQGSVLRLLLGTVIFILSCMLPVVFMENMLGLHPKLFNKKPFGAVAANGIYSYLLLIAAGLANSLFLSAVRMLGLEFAPQSLSVPESTAGAVIYFIYICILPPLLEEIFVRGYILNALKPYGVSFAVVMSSAIFALMHQGLENFLLYFICGVILARVYLSFDSIFASMLVHFINNTMSFFMLWFQTRANDINTLTLVATVNIFVFVLGLAGKWYLNKNGFGYTKVLYKDGDMGAKLASMRSCPVAVAALGLLLFFAATASFNKLI